MDKVRLNERLADVVPYDPKYLPADVMLSANESPYNIPDDIRYEIRKRLKRLDFNRYPDPLANELRDELAAWHGVARESVMVGNGGDELLFNLIFSFGGPGRSLVVAPPCFEEYKNFAKMCETDVVEVWRDPQSLLPDADALVDAAREAAIVMITSPNNPTGDLVDSALVRRLLDETDALVLLDEAYVEFAGAQASLVSWVATNPRLMVLRTLSKAFALAGLRCGYLIADPQVIDVLAAIRQIYSEDVLAQAVATQAVRSRAELAPIVADIVAERKQLAERLARLPGAHVWPSQANFLLVRLPNAAVVRARLRDEHSVLVRDFSYAKGLADCLRVTVGTHAENNRLMAALAAVVEGGQA